MPVPQATLQSINKLFPKPRVDLEWLNDCYDWVVSEGLDNIIPAIRTEILSSDLRASMQPSTGLPAAQIAATQRMRLPKSPPVLVMVTAITEVGQSAFQLQTTRQTRLDRADMGDEEARIQMEEDEGPVPDYPRGMLEFRITDGTNEFKAVEWRSLPQFKLGETMLGCKLRLRDVLFKDGIAYLEPQTIIFEGHHVADLEAKQDKDFVRSLNRRLGQPEESDDEEGEQQQQDEARRDDPPPPPDDPAPAPAPRHPQNAIPRRAASPPAARQPHHRSRSRAPSPLPADRSHSSSSTTLIQSPYFTTSTSTSTSTANTAASSIRGSLALSPASRGNTITSRGDDEFDEYEDEEFDFEAVAMMEEQERERDKENRIDDERQQQQQDEDEWNGDDADDEDQWDVVDQQHHRREQKQKQKQPSNAARMELERKWGVDGRGFPPPNINSNPSPIAGPSSSTQATSRRTRKKPPVVIEEAHSPIALSSSDYGEDDAMVLDSDILNGLDRAERDAFRFGSTTISDDDEMDVKPKVEKMDGVKTFSTSTTSSSSRRQTRDEDGSSDIEVFEVPVPAPTPVPVPMGRVTLRRKKKPVQAQTQAMEIEVIEISD